MPPTNINPSVVAANPDLASHLLSANRRMAAEPLVKDRRFAGQEIG
ncbi:MAG: hypothetical protein AAF641_07195 [Pseudomonadota bacterium]